MQPTPEQSDILDHEAQNQALVIGHLHKTEDSNMDKLMAKGWYGVGEMIEMMRVQIREIAMRRAN